MLTADDVSRLYDIRDVTGKSSRKIICPLPDHKHQNYTPSFSIFFSGGKQRWHCHGCGKRGDVIDLTGYMNMPGYDPGNPIESQNIEANIADAVRRYVFNR